MTRRVLVVHRRLPVFDRDSGSHDIDNMLRFLAEDGWVITYVSATGEEEAEERHVRRLRDRGVATYNGLHWVEPVVQSTDFDLAVVAFWDIAETVIPVLRRLSPDTRVLVNSVDLHLLRLARDRFAARRRLDSDYGEAAARELSVYDAADGVLAVSDKERDLIGEFIGAERTFTVSLAEEIERSTTPLADRRGMFFVGNFRHEPNVAAVEFLANEVLPLLDPELVASHPLRVVGNHLDQVDVAVDPHTPGLELVGWVPSLRPELTRARVTVAAVLTGAGVNRKVLQSMMAGTPVVTTPTGADGLDLIQGEHALIGADAGDLAAGITRLLTDDQLWERVASAGAGHIEARHGLEPIRKQFDHAVATLLDRPARGAGLDATDTAAVRGRVQTLAAPGQPVLMVSGGDEALIDLGSAPCWPFPEGRDGTWAGYDPVDGPAAVTHLEAQRSRGARWFALPRASYSWRHRFPELFLHLETVGRAVHVDDDVTIFDLDPPTAGTSIGPAPAASVQVIGTYPAHRTGPSPRLVSELGRSTRLRVQQTWTADDQEPTAVDPAADFVVRVHAGAVLPDGFLDDLIGLQHRLGEDRVQPAHHSGPSAGPPVTERHHGTVARRVGARTPLPVLSLRKGIPADGPTVLVDAVTVGLRDPITTEDPAATDPYSTVDKVWLADGEDIGTWERDPLGPTPRISVVISTYERPGLLRAALEAFAEQTLARDDYEVVVIDDGSADPVVDALVAEFADRMAVDGFSVGHAGRSAAKNHGVLVARAPIVLFFDDDDRPAADYLERHLAGHERHPEATTAILGHTDWAPELVRTPLMHFVTDVDRLMFAYERLEDGQELDWRGFWEGRISCKRRLLTRRGLHDQRLNYSIDVEMAWRLTDGDLKVVYDATAASVMARPLDVASFCARTQAKGRAQAVIASLHRGTEMAARLRIDDAVTVYENVRFTEAGLRHDVEHLEAAVAAATDPTDHLLAELHGAYRALFRVLNAKGVAEATGATTAMSSPPTTVHPFENTDPDLHDDGSPSNAATDPALTVTLPVWSRTPELAEMAAATIERIWEVARVPTEVVVVDNGSPYEVPYAAKVYRYPENKGVATGWNTGIRLATAPAVVVLNSDCRVEPGWDEALLEAGLDGRRIAFPYTDHCDGLGFSLPDQGGTAGWCFLLTKALYDEVGPFDEWFNPAFCEDTDYWHRAWEMGIELTPVPAARVVHARRTTASTHPHVDWLLQGHRYKYGWKHGVDPHRAPPYYDREIVEYHGPTDAADR